MNLRIRFFVFFLLLAAAASALGDTASITRRIIETPVDGGIREEIPGRSRARYEKWKAELLSTRFGREQWDGYEQNKAFVLTIKVSDRRGKGAETGKFAWDAAGNLVGATIILGAHLDRGYPPPTYYPVLNSLASASPPGVHIGDILAATKFSHEISHVTQAANSDSAMLQTQDRLLPAYVSIFLKNGLNVKDKRLVDMAHQMGGTPTEIWESREYWSEVDAMNFLRERIAGERYYCDVVERIKTNLTSYAGVYRIRFDESSQLAEAPCRK